MMNYNWFRSKQNINIEHVPKDAQIKINLILPGLNLPDPVSYKFQEFPYFETRKNEALFREYVKACEQSPWCWNLEGVEQTSCVREAQSLYLLPPVVKLYYNSESYFCYCNVNQHYSLSLLLRQILLSIKVPCE